MRTEAAAAPAPAEPEPEAPDRARSRRITTVVVLLSAVVAALWVIGPYVFAGRDDPTAIDRTPVRQAVQAGCTQLRADLAALPPDLRPADRAEAQNRAVDEFVGKVRSLGPEALAGDVPVEQWLSDWEQIVAARRQAVREGRRFAPPMADVGPVNVRMFALIRSGLTECDVPEALLTPEPGKV